MILLSKLGIYFLIFSSSDLYSAFFNFILELNFKSDILNFFDKLKLKLFFEDKRIFFKFSFFNKYIYY